MELEIISNRPFLIQDSISLYTEPYSKLLRQKAKRHAINIYLWIATSPIPISQPAKHRYGIYSISVCKT